MDSKLLNYAKSPIPILNNSSPHNYAIMSALLSNIDSSPPTPRNKNNPKQQQSNNSFNSFQSTEPLPQQQHNQLLTNRNNQVVEQPKPMEKDTANKELIYATKQLHIQQGHQQHQQQQATATTCLPDPMPPHCIDMSDVAHSNYMDHSGPFTEFFRLPSNQRILEHHQAITPDTILIDDNNNNATKYVNNCAPNPNKTNKNLVSLQESNSFLSKTSKSIENSAFINNQLSNDICNLNQPDQSYLNQRPDIFTEKSNADPNNHEIMSTQTATQEDNHCNNASRGSVHNEVVTYTISCPAEWQHNLDRMVNCFVMFKDLNKSNSSGRVGNVTLKCSVCQMVFYALSELQNHKEMSDMCRNDMRIRDDIASDLGRLERKNRRKREPIRLDLTSFSYQEKDMEPTEEATVSSNLNDEKLTSDSESEEELIDDETLHMNLFGTALKNNVNFKKRLMNNSSFKSNKLLTELTYNQSEIIGQHEALLSLNEEFAKNSKSSNNQNEKLAKPRRKYNKNKNDHVTHLTCEHCNKTCRTKAELLVHLHKHSGNEPECWVCGKTCASFSNLVSHVQLHTGEKPYTCQYCGKQFTQDAHLTRHIRLHTGERPFVCNICGKNYKDYSYYKTHLRIHRGERLYKCKYCNKEYYDASYYKKHTRLHTGEKPYMCTVCGKQFHRSDYLKLHSYSHTEERPFNCHICGKGFKMNYNLKVHLRNHGHDHQKYTKIISSSNDETSTTFSISESSINSSNAMDMSNINNSTNCENTSSSLSYFNSTDNLLAHDGNKSIGAFVNTDSLVSHQDENQIGLSLNEVSGNLGHHMSSVAGQNHINTNDMVSYVISSNDQLNNAISNEMNKLIDLIGNKTYDETPIENLNDLNQ